MRRAFFVIHGREHENAFYLMKLAKLHRKSGSSDALLVNKLFRECKVHAARIVNYELEYAKYTMQIKNAHEAYQYLSQQMSTIERKCDEAQKMFAAAFAPKLVKQKAELLKMELLIKTDPRNVEIKDKFRDLAQNQEELKWEKPCFRYAQYLDMLDN